MKVFMVAQGDTPHSTRPLNWLLDRDCSVTFVDRLRPVGVPSSKYAFLRYPIVRFVSKFSPSLGLELNRRLRIPWWRRECDKVQPDVVHVHWVDERAFQCAEAGLRPLVLSVWGSDINRLFTDDPGPTSQEGIARALRAADRILVDAPKMTETCQHLAQQELPVEVMTIGISTSLFRAGLDAERTRWRDELEIPADATVLLSARAMLTTYAHADILEAFRLALPRFNGPAVLLFRSIRHEPGTHDVELRRMATEHGISQHIRWIGELDYERLPELYALTDVVLNYPVRDAFPVTFLEAAACETPVISCQLPEYMDSLAEDYFRMVPAENPPRLADAMVEFVNSSPSERSRHVAAARDEVVRLHDESVTGDRLLEIYREVGSLCSSR